MPLLAVVVTAALASEPASTSPAASDAPPPPPTAPSTPSAPPAAGADAQPGPPAQGAEATPRTDAMPPPAPPPAETAAPAAPSGPAAPPRPVNERELRELAASVAATVAGPALVTAAGPEAERFAVDALDDAPPGTARVVRVGILGDIEAEVARARESNGTPCAVRVALSSSAGRPGESLYHASLHGACGALAVNAPVDASAQAPPAAAPAAPALPAPPATPEEREQREAAWRNAALTRVELPRSSAVGWTIRDGSGAPLDALAFARAVGDLATERRILAEAESAKAMGWGLGVAGGSLLAAGLGVLAARGANPPQWSDYVVEATDYVSSEEYLTAVDLAEASYLAATEQYEIRRDDRAWTAGFLSLTGLITLGSAPFATKGAEARARDAAWHWSLDEADRLVAIHNAALRTRLGLPPLDAPKGADAAAVATPAAGTDLEGTKDADPPDEEDGADPPEDTDEATDAATEPAAPGDEIEEAP
jgi:hypothetical protein